MTPILPDFHAMVSLANAIGSGQFHEEDGLICCASEVPDGHFDDRQRQVLLDVGWHLDQHDHIYWLEGFSV
jgi:hypothetical protein